MFHYQLTVMNVKTAQTCASSGDYYFVPFLSSRLLLPHPAAPAAAASKPTTAPPRGGAAAKKPTGADAAPKGKVVKGGKGAEAKKGGKAAPAGKGAPAEDKTEKILAAEEIEEKANEILGKLDSFL